LIPNEVSKTTEKILLTLLIIKSFTEVLDGDLSLPLKQAMGCDCGIFFP